jgi:putative oxidoreductase
MKNQSLGILLIRISIAGLMLFHGVAKLVYGIDGIIEMLGPVAYGVYVGEVLAPIAIILGFRTRIAAMIFTINCLVAIIAAHSADLFSVTEHGGHALELIYLYLFGGVALIFTGAGKYAVSTKNKWD